jgi:hypothetical protein
MKFNGRAKELNLKITNIQLKLKPSVNNSVRVYIIHFNLRMKHLCSHKYNTEKSKNHWIFTRVKMNLNVRLSELH